MHCGTHQSADTRGHSINTSSILESECRLSVPAAREISAADTSGELHPSAAHLLVSKRAKFSSVFVHAVVPLRKTSENVPATSKR